MSKLAHHHPGPFMGKTMDWAGKILIAAAFVGVVVVLFSAFTSHVIPSW